MRWNPNPEGGNNERDSYEHKDLLKSYDKSTYAWQPDMEDTILRVSKSTLGTFHWCAQQYFIEKVLGHTGETRDYHVRGSNVHDAVEYWWKAMTPIVHTVYELIQSGDREKALTMCIEALPAPPEPYIYGEPEQLRIYVTWQFERLCNCTEEEVRDWFPVGNEAEIHATRMVVASDGTEVPIHMKGYIDRMFLDDSRQGVVLMELKTGKWKPNKASDMRAEMQFYRMMLEHSPHGEFLPITGWGWAFPGGGINGGTGPHWDYESVSGPGGRYAPKSVEKRLTSLVDAHLSGDFLPTSADFKCGFCDYMELCPRWRPEQ